MIIVAAKNRNRIALSVCIPTYNRAKYMSAALENYEKILPASGLQGKVEVCISDNTPTAETRKAVLPFLKRGKILLSYRQNRKNLGFDRNSILAMRMAKGRFIHLVSDEELYDGRMLQGMVSDLESGKCDCVFTNQTVIFGMTQADIERFEQEPMLLLCMGRLYLSLFCLSSAIIPRESFLGFLQSHGIEEYCGSFFAFAPIYINAMRACRRLKVLRAPYSSIPKSAFKAHLPHDQARTFDYNFFSMMATAEKQRVITKSEFEYFKRAIFLRHAIRGMLLYRTYIHPRIYGIEGEKTASYYYRLGQDWGFGPAGKRLFPILVRLVYNPYLPYHLLYRIYYWAKKNVLGDSAIMDRHRLFEEILFGKKKYELGMNR